MNSTQKFVSVLCRVAFIAAILCSTAYLLMLGWYNNFLLDDYSFISDVDNGGAWGLTKHAYLNWQSRFTTFYVVGWIYEIWGHASNLIGYTILLLVLGYGTIYYALRNITKNDDRWLLAGSSILITNVAIMAYLELSTFYWVCCALYTLSTYAAIILITAIFYSKGELWARWLAVILSSLYLCGGAENFTPLLIAVLGVILLIQMIQSRIWIFWKTQEQRMMITSLLILFIGFIAVIKGPGTSIRAVGDNPAGFMEHFELVLYIQKFVAASVVFAMRVVSRGLYYLLLFPIGVLIGKQMEETKSAIWKPLLISLLIVVAIIELSLAASVYGMGWYASLRAYSFVSFMIAAMVIYWGMLMGRKYRGNTAVIMATISATIILAMSIYFTRTEYPLVKNYHEQIVRCNSTIQSHVQSGSSDPLVLEEIPYPVVPNSYAILRASISKCIGKSISSVPTPSTYFPYEQYRLSTDPERWENMSVKKCFKADFDIIGWSE